jgi:hypothetical protein
MSKIIMEEIGLSCTNGNAKRMLSYNSLQQMNIGEIKDVTLVLCAHPEIRTTLSIQVIDMPVRNCSIILGRDWKSLMGVYLSLYRTHFFFFFFFMLAESATGPISYSRDTGSIPTATTITSRCHTYAPSAGTGKSGGFELETSSYITRYITALAN